jgi:hypothetical protein
LRDIPRFTRRRFLGTLGAGAAGAVALRIGLLLGVEADSSASGIPAFPGAFGRIFAMLRPFAPATDAVQAAMLDIGRPGGPMDALDSLTFDPSNPSAGGPVALITNLALSANNPNNPAHSAGTTFMGQFMDHDMTFDATSPLGIPTDPTTSPNSRTARFDLDSVYGLGPINSPQLYDPNDSAKFLLGFGGMFEDLLRRMDLAPNSPNPTAAVIGDPRNDENVMIAGLHCAFQKFHNHAVDYVRSQGISDPTTVFLNARLLTTWHYQWMIVHEFLPLFVGQPMVNDILNNGPQVYAPKTGQGFIPVEFQTGSYRFGHSMVRPSYRANFTGDPNSPFGVAPAFFGLVFDPSQHPEDTGGTSLADPSDLSGGARAPRRFVGWRTFFNFGDGNAKSNKKTDTTISSPLFKLPLRAIPPQTPPQALPQRNLLRHVTWSLPSGQAVAQHLGLPVLSPDHFPELVGYGLGLETSTPLWFYVLKESGVTQTSTITLVPSPLGPPGTPITSTGLMLGPVGARIVGEVILGLLTSDPTSYLSAQPGWQPTLPRRNGSTSGPFQMIDFLTYAGVDALR